VVRKNNFLSVGYRYNSPEPTLEIKVYFIKMTSGERFKLTLQHKLPDRLPMDLLWPRVETLAALRRHFRTESDEEVRRRLDLDFRWIGIPARYPEFAKKINGRLSGESPSAGKEFIFRDSRTFTDQWGIVRRVGEDGNMRNGATVPWLAGKRWRTGLPRWQPIPRPSNSRTP
jgi:hypothetical protein